MSHSIPSSKATAAADGHPPVAILRILLVRHGLSEDNQNGIWAGHRDSALTSTGINQARALGSALADCSLVAIYSSDLKRASRTAEEILTANRSVPPPTFVQTQSLREQNFGHAEGRTYAEAEHSYLASTQGEDARSARFSDGETLDEVNARMGVSLRRYVLPRLESLRSGQHPGTEPQVVIVAHGVAIAETLRVLMNLHDRSDGGPWPDPRSTYKRVRLENTGWTLVEVAVPILGPDRLPTDPGSRSTYVQIIQQNVTDHLRAMGLNSSNASTASTSGQQGSTSLGSSLLSGALSGSTNDPADMPQTSTLAQQSLRKIPSYDARQLTRELERAGASAPMLPGTNNREVLLPANTIPQSIASPASIASPSAHGSVSTSTSTPSTLMSAPGSWSETWQTVCVQVLPLFNGEVLKAPVEDINDSVSEHIKRSLERSPARALDSLSKDLYALCATGMYTINARLDVDASQGVHLLHSLTGVWRRFHGRILPWLEGCFLPLQTNGTLLSLSKSEDNPSSSLRTERIEVARVALTVFRDQIILPRFERIFALFLRINEIEAALMSARANRPRQARHGGSVGDGAFDNESMEEDRMLYPNLLQLSSIAYSVLTNDDAQRAMESLIRALRAGHDAAPASADRTLEGEHYGRVAASPAARNKRTQARQGWLPRSAAKHGARAPSSADRDEEDGEDEEELVDAMRHAHVLNKAAARSENAFLSSLRSPTLTQEDDSVEGTPIQNDLHEISRDANDKSDPGLRRDSVRIRPSDTRTGRLRHGAADVSQVSEDDSTEANSLNSLGSHGNGVSRKADVSASPGTDAIVGANFRPRHASAGAASGSEAIGLGVGLDTTIAQ